MDQDQPQAPPKALPLAWLNKRKPDKIRAWLDAVHSGEQQRILAAAPAAAAAIDRAASPQTQGVLDRYWHDIDALVLPAMTASPKAFAALLANVDKTPLLAAHLLTRTAVSPAHMATVAHAFDAATLSAAAHLLMTDPREGHRRQPVYALHLSTILSALVDASPEVFRTDFGFFTDVDITEQLFYGDMPALARVIHAAHPELRQAIAQGIIDDLAEKPKLLAEALGDLQRSSPDFVSYALAQLSKEDCHSEWIYRHRIPVDGMDPSAEVQLLATTLMDRLMAEPEVEEVLAAMETPEGMREVAASAKKNVLAYNMIEYCLSHPDEKGSVELASRLVDLPEVAPDHAADAIFSAAPEDQRALGWKSSRAAIRAVLTALALRPDGEDWAFRAIGAIITKLTQQGKPHDTWVKMHAEVEASVLSQKRAQAPSAPAPKM